MQKHRSWLALGSIAIIVWASLLLSPQEAVHANKPQACYVKPCPTPGGGSGGKKKRATSTSIPPTQTPTPTPIATVTPSPTSTQTSTPAAPALIVSPSSALLAAAIPSPSRVPAPVAAGGMLAGKALPIAGVLLAVALAALAAYWLKYSLFLPDGTPTRTGAHVAMKQAGKASDTTQSDSSGDGDADGDDK